MPCITIFFCVFNQNMQALYQSGLLMQILISINSYVAGNKTIFHGICNAVFCSQSMNCQLHPNPKATHSWIHPLIQVSCQQEHQERKVTSVFIQFLVLTLQCLMFTKRSHILKQIYSRSCRFVQVCVTFQWTSDTKGLT